MTGPTSGPRRPPPGDVDILFAVSPSNAREYFMPFYFLYLAGYLERQGLSAAISDPHEVTEEENVARIIADIRYHRPRWVGLAAFVTDYDTIVRLAERVKEETGVPVVVGNAHPSVNPSDFLYEGSPFDLVVRGEGELTIAQVLREWDPDGDNAHIDGIAYRRGGEEVVTERRELMDLTDLGMPAYHLIDIEWYAKPTKWVIRRLPASSAVIYTGRGCPYRCGFCAANTVWSANATAPGRPVVRHRPLAAVMAELALLQDEYGFDFFYILDDTFGARRGDIIDFCEAYRASGLRMRWAAETRVSAIKDAETVEALRKAGCIQLDFGLESGSPAMLEVVRKGTTVGQAKLAFRLCRDAGIRTFANVLVNLPGETEEDLRLTRELLDAIRPTFTSVGVTQPYPGTAFYRDHCRSISRHEYHKLSRLLPDEEFRMAAHDLDLRKLLYDWLFRYQVYTPLDRSMFQAAPEYWGRLWRSRRRWAYLRAFAVELVRSPIAYVVQRLRYNRI